MRRYYRGIRFAADARYNNLTNGQDILARCYDDCKRALTQAELAIRNVRSYDDKEAAELQKTAYKVWRTLKDDLIPSLAKASNMQIHDI